MCESEYFLLILVNARHLDYTNNRSLLKTIAKHPSDGSKNGDVGHAWIYMQGMVDGRCVCVEGGHSGERGWIQPKYFEGVMNYIDYGCLCPSKQQAATARYEPNPIKYLWATQEDGFFQEGSGEHTPTYAAKVDITSEQFQSILSFIQPENYPYSEYSLTGNQCSEFVARIGEIAGLELECKMTISIDQIVAFGGRSLCMWRDPRYAMFTFSSPDALERSLMQAVCDKRAEYALPWYMSRKKSIQHRGTEPQRTQRRKKEREGGNEFA